MSLPENHVVAEGRTLAAAREAAAAQLGVPLAAVDHKLDLAHFKASGTAGATTVKIFAWAKNVELLAPALAAEAWVKTLLAGMGRGDALVRAEMKGDTAVVFVDAKEGARHLVGRQGTTLRAIQHLLERNVGREHPSSNFRLDIARNDDGERRDDRPRDDRGPRRDDRPRDDRPRGERRDDRPRDDRPRDDRGPRRDDRGPRRDDRGGDRPRRNDGEQLKSLARKLAQKVLETGEPEVIRRELNSFDRRLVHLEIAEITGVASRSVGEGAERRVEIYVPRGDEGAAE